MKGGVEKLMAKDNSPGMSPETVLNGTGKPWEEWLALLDAAKGTSMNHAELARFVEQNFEVSGWWAQGIAIGYEYARGMRERGMTSDGFATNASKTLNLAVEQVWELFGDSDLRAKWLDPQLLEQTSATRPRTFNAKWLADDSRVSVNFTSKGDNKSSFAIQHRRLQHQDDIATVKAFWKQRIAELVKVANTL